jgi:hypothetical protein
VGFLVLIIIVLLYIRRTGRAVSLICLFNLIETFAFALVIYLTVLECGCVMMPAKPEIVRLEAHLCGFGWLVGLWVG